MQEYVLLFFRAFVVTITIETAVLGIFIFLRRPAGMPRKPGLQVLKAGLAASTVTLPFVWFVFPVIIENRMIFLAVAELFAFAAEIPIIRGIVKTGWNEAAAASLLANGTSFISGLLMGMS